MRIQRSMKIKKTHHVRFARPPLKRVFLCKKKQRLILTSEVTAPFLRGRLCVKNRAKACRGVVHISSRSWKLLVIFTPQKKFLGLEGFL